MKMKILCTLFSIIFIHQSVFAQTPKSTFIVKGQILDSALKAPVDYAAVALKSASGEVVKSINTNTDGVFNFEGIANGNYKLVVSAVGYHPYNKDFVLKGESVDLDKIYVNAVSTTLETTVVKADRPLIKQEVDRISYDIQADPESKIKTVLDMMRKVPLLAVDGDDNVKLNGNSNYKILINGKPSSMMARSPKEVLRSMPASSILKIEVITTPPAKYDSEGIAGLINIVTLKKVDNGYNGTLGTRYNFPVGGLGYNASLNLKQGNFGFSGYGGISNYDQPKLGSSSSRTTTTTNPTLLDQVGTARYKNRNLYFGSELSYEIDTLNLISAEISSYNGKYNSEDQKISALYDQFNTVMQGYEIGLDSKNKWGGLDLSVNYQLGFKNKPERLLTFSYNFSDGNDDYVNNMLLSNKINYTMPNYRQINNSISKDQTAQLDYVYPLKSLTIEAGLKAILRNNDSDFENLLDNGSGQFLPDQTLANSFRNKQKIYGAYNSYTYNVKNWGFKGGVRIEETVINANFLTNGTLVDQDYFNVIPNISISKKFKDMSSINMGYTQRIQRPSIYNLNPFVDKSNPNFESAGNPDLVPVLSNNINVRYNRFKKGSFNIGLNYSFANNTIQNVSIFDPTTNITRSNYLNIGKDKSLGTNFSINYPFTKRLNANVGGNMNYMWIQGIVNGSVEKNSGLRGYIYGGVDYKFENGLRLSSNFSYSSPYIRLQGKSNSYLYTSFSANKDIIKDKISFSAGINNPFKKFNEYKSETQGVNFIQNSYSQNYYRSYNMSLNYKFGKLKDEIKKNKRGINNDDKSGGKG